MVLSGVLCCFLLMVFLFNGVFMVLVFCVFMLFFVMFCGVVLVVLYVAVPCLLDFCLPLGYQECVFKTNPFWTIPIRTF